MASPDHSIAAALAEARRHYAAGAPDRAMAACRAVLDIDDGNPEALRLLARLAADAGQAAPAIAFLKRLVAGGGEAASDWGNLKALLDAEHGRSGRVVRLVASRSISGAGEIFRAGEDIPAAARRVPDIVQKDFPSSFAAHPVFLFTAQDATVTANGLVATAAGELVADGLSYFRLHRKTAPAVLSVYTEIKAISAAYAQLAAPARTRHIEGTALLLSAGPVPRDHYYHWLIDSLPRLWALDEHQDLAGVPIIVNERLSGQQRDSLAMLGIGADRLISKRDDEALVCETLIAPSYCARTGCVYPLAAEFLRRHFALPPAAARRRLYVSRKNARSRRLVNEAEVEAFLGDRGFEIVVPDELAFAQQVELFATAEIVAGGHGGGLANMVFAPPGAPFVEIVTKFQPSLACIAALGGRAHWHAVARVAGDGEGMTNERPDEAAYEMPLAELAALIDRVL